MSLYTIYFNLYNKGRRRKKRKKVEDQSVTLLGVGQNCESFNFMNAIIIFFVFYPGIKILKTRRNKEKLK